MLFHIIVYWYCWWLWKCGNICYKRLASMGTIPILSHWPVWDVCLPLPTWDPLSMQCTIIWWPYPITLHTSNWPPHGEINHAVLQLTCLHWVCHIFQSFLSLYLSLCCWTFSDTYSPSLLACLCCICLHIARHHSICMILQLYVIEVIVQIKIIS